MDTTDNTEAMVDRLLGVQEEVVEEQPLEDEQTEVQAEEEDQVEDDQPETDEDAETAEDDAPPKYTVKVDGKEIEVTLEDLKREYSGQAYIQKGMQQAAEAKKQADALYQTLQQQQAEVIAFAEQIRQQGFKQPPAVPDMAMLETDPIGYMQAEARYRKELGEFQAQQQQVQTLATRQSQLQSQALADFVKEQGRILQERIPEFSDPKRAGEITGKIRKTGVETYGFSEAELDTITDARHVQVLHDAMRWRELQVGKATAVKKPINAPRNVVPQPRRSEPAQLARKREIEQARKSGKAESFVDLLLKR